MKGGGPGVCVCVGGGGGGGGVSEPKGANITVVSSDIKFLFYMLCFQGGGFRAIPHTLGIRHSTTGHLLGSDDV